MPTQSRRQTADEKLALMPRVLAGYARDIEKYGRPVDSGLPSTLRFIAEQIENLRAMNNADIYTVTIVGGARIFGKKEDVENIQKAIDLALSRGCNHCSESISKARAILGSGL